MRKIMLVPLGMLLVGAEACGCWEDTCDDFSCSSDTIYVASGQSKTDSPSFCHPWDDPKAEYTAESLDTAVVTVTVHGQRVTFTARNPGQTAVRVRATLVGERNTGLFNYNVITTAPIDPQM